jgi:hypothetical protein
VIISHHAGARMQHRAIDQVDIALVIEFGRTFHCRGAEIKVIGHKEVEHYREQIDLREQAGIHVVISSDGCIITTYRNQNFKRSDFRKPRRRRHRGTLPRRFTGKLIVPVWE